MKFLPILALTCLCGCAAPTGESGHFTWYKPDANPIDIERSIADCRLYAEQMRHPTIATDGSAALGQAIAQRRQQKQNIEDCMKVKGFVLIDKSKIPQPVPQIKPTDPSQSGTRL